MSLAELAPSSPTTLAILIMQPAKQQSPIEILITDILITIFEYTCIFGNSYHGNILSGGSGSVNCPAFTLASVCRLWREIAVLSPSIWSTLHVFCSKPGQSLALDVALNRSQQSPLTITVRGTLYDTDTHWNLMRLVRETHRWSSFQFLLSEIVPPLAPGYSGLRSILHSISSVPILSSFGTNVPIPTFYALDQAPALSHLDLTNGVCLTHHRNLPWNHIRAVKLTNMLYGVYPSHIPLTTVQNVVSLCSDLKHLELVQIHVFPLSDISPNPFSSPLTSLTVSAAADMFIELLNAAVVDFRLPSLRVLALTFQGPVKDEKPLAESVVRFLQEACSSPQITELHLCGDISTACLLPVFPLVPNLVLLNLELPFSNACGAFVRSMVPASAPGVALLPKMEKLFLAVAQDGDRERNQPTDFLHLLRMIENRIAGRRQSLRSFKIEVTMKEGECYQNLFNEDVWAVWERLRTPLPSLMVLKYPNLRQYIYTERL
ncbi:hypothetical protein VKT23_019433 [Stygiomarasmius scandens]|uniref:F-box domain-containing protein n=1 Tax=Marasmiellus scandens TaxID=2682957 RepID=A0ABR1IN11_9AGAR